MIYISINTINMRDKERTLPTISNHLIWNTLAKKWTNIQQKIVNSLVPGRCGSSFISKNFSLIIQNTSLHTRQEITFRWMPQYLSNEKSTLVQVMAWCRQATSHYPSQYWPRSMSPYGVTKPQWVLLCNTTRTASHKAWNTHKTNDPSWAVHLMQGRSMATCSIHHSQRRSEDRNLTDVYVIAGSRVSEWMSDLV